MIEELVHTAVLSAHEYPSGRFGRAYRVHDDVVGRDRVDGLRREAHLVHNGAVAFREANKVNREQDHLGVGCQAQSVLNRLVKCSFLLSIKISIYIFSN